MNQARYLRLVTVFLASPWVATATGQQIAAGRVSLELVTTRQASMTSAQEWARALGRLGVDNARIRAARGSERPEIIPQGQGVSRTYHVRGLLMAGNRVRVPGATFSLSQAQQFRDWLDKLAAGGVEEVTAERGAFGMTARQLVTTHDALQARVTFSTASEDAATVAERLLEEATLPTTVTSGAVGGMQEKFTLADQLQGLSHGTALAAALRPLGLVMVPRVPKAGASVQLEVRDTREAPESWPVGWPLGDNRTRDVAPALFTFLEIKFQDAPLDQVLAALQQRLESANPDGPQRLSTTRPRSGQGPREHRTQEDVLQKYLGQSSGTGQTASRDPFGRSRAGRSCGSCRSNASGYNNSSNSSTRFSKYSKAAVTGAGVAMSTPASRNSSSGNFDEPPFRNPR